MRKRIYSTPPKYAHHWPGVYYSFGSVGSFTGKNGVPPGEFLAYLDRRTVRLFRETESRSKYAWRFLHDQHPVVAASESV